MLWLTQQHWLRLLLCAVQLNGACSLPAGGGTDPGWLAPGCNDTAAGPAPPAATVAAWPSFKAKPGPSMPTSPAAEDAPSGAACTDPRAGCCCCRSSCSSCARTAGSASSVSTASASTKVGRRAGSCERQRASRRLRAGGQDGGSAKNSRGRLGTRLHSRRGAGKVEPQRIGVHARTRRTGRGGGGSASWGGLRACAGCSSDAAAVRLQLQRTF